MTWQGGYYYRSERQGRRVVRRYIGKGVAAEIIARADELERARRRVERARLRIDKAQAAELLAALAALRDQAAEATRQALEAAGFRERRGEWRRRR